VRSIAVLGCLAVLAEPAHADDVETKLGRAVLASIRASDSDAFRKQVGPLPLRLYHVWFDSPACSKEFGGKVAVAAGRLRALVACLARLELADGVEGTFIHAPGVAIAPLVYRGKLAGLGGVTVAPGVPTVSDAALAKHLTAGALAVTPDAATLAAKKSVTVWLEACVDPKGAVTSISTKRATSPAYAKVIEAAAARWTFRPFMRAGKAIRVCLQRRYAYPVD
jgi:hypothetical protein